MLIENVDTERADMAYTDDDGEHHAVVNMPIIVQQNDRRYQIRIDEYGDLVIVGLNPFCRLVMSCDASNIVRINNR